MAKDTAKTEDKTLVADEAGAKGTSAPTNAGSADAVGADSRVDVTRQVGDEMEIHFNPSTGLETLVMEDGTEVSEGDRVESSVYDKLKDRKLDGYDLLMKEAE